MTALRATTLAPDVQSYYRQASRMFDMLASDAVSADSKQRWALGAYTFGRQAADANGLDPAARAALAGKAISLGLLGEAGRFEEAVELYEGVVAMSPRFATVRYAAASAMLLAGDPEAALHELDAGDTLLNQAERRPSVAAQGTYLRGIARRQQGDIGEAVQYLERSLTLEPAGRYAAGAHRILAELYEDLDDSVKAAEHREAAE